MLIYKLNIFNVRKIIIAKFMKMYKTYLFVEFHQSRNLLRIWESNLYTTNCIRMFVNRMRSEVYEHILNYDDACILKYFSGYTVGILLCTRTSILIY